MSTALTFVAFWGLVAHVASAPDRRQKLREKRLTDWALELTNLFVQGGLIPVVLVVYLVKLWGVLLPGLGSSVALPPAFAFLLNVVGVDYLYYWNHRLLHTDSLWPVHLVHHSATSMDVFATSRNTVLTSFIIVYLWVNSLALYLLTDARYFLLGAGVTAVLDLWRHSAFGLEKFPRASKYLGGILVLPNDHAWHHSVSAERGNYAANFIVWDRLHGTWLGERHAAPAGLGVPCEAPLWRRLVWPF